MCLAKKTYYTPGDYKDVDLAWLAGIIDGEGSIFISKYPKKSCVKGYGFRCGIHVGTTDGIIPYECKRIAGFGQVYENIHIQNGKLHKDVATWCIGTRQALAILKQCHPYLRYKKSQAELVFKYYELMDSDINPKERSAFYEEFYNQMKALHE